MSPGFPHCTFLGALSRLQRAQALCLSTGLLLGLGIHVWLCQSVHRAALQLMGTNVKSTVSYTDPHLHPVHPLLHLSQHKPHVSLSLPNWEFNPGLHTSKAGQAKAVPLSSTPGPAESLSTWNLPNGTAWLDFPKVAQDLGAL